MSAIKEDFVSFELAKLLKEKEFDVPCNCYGAYNGVNLTYRLCITNKYTNWNKHTDERIISCPTLQMAMKWLREVHHIHTEICLYKTNKDDIEPKKSRKAPYYTFGVWNSVTGDNIDKRLTNDFIGDTYEQACEAAIKYCLENLI